MGQSVRMLVSDDVHVQVTFRCFETADCEQISRDQFASHHVASLFVQELNYHDEPDSSFEKKELTRDLFSFSACRRSRYKITVVDRTGNEFRQRR